MAALASVVLNLVLVPIVNLQVQFEGVGRGLEIELQGWIWLDLAGYVQDLSPCVHPAPQARGQWELQCRAEHITPHTFLPHPRRPLADGR